MRFSFGTNKKKDVVKFVVFSYLFSISLVPEVLMR